MGQLSIRISPCFQALSGLAVWVDSWNLFRQAIQTHQILHPSITYQSDIKALKNIPIQKGPPDNDEEKKPSMQQYWHRGKRRDY